MSLPYIPGFWDEISQGATKLAGQLPAVFQPNEVANKKLEELVRQNPMIMTQIADMDETQRQAFASALGFKDYSKSKIGGIAEGPQLRARKEDAAFFAANPGSKDRAIAARNQTKTAQDLGREDTLFGLNTRKTEQDLRTGAQTEQLNAIKLQEEKEMQTLASTLKVKYPSESFNVEQAAMDFISGKLNTPELQRITTDPTISGAFNTYIDLYKQRLQLQAQKDIAGLRSREEKLLGINFLQQAVDNAQQKITAAETRVKDLGGIAAMGVFVTPEQKTQYDTAVSQRAAAYNEHRQLVSAFNSALKTEFGGKYPDVFDQNKIGLGSETAGPRAAPGTEGNFFGSFQGGVPAAPRSAEVEKIKADYNSGKITATAIKASKRISEEDKAYIIGGK
jgi:hypothetical protein